MVVASVFSFLIAIDSFAVAWEFAVVEGDKLSLRIRKKLACAENIVLEVSDVSEVNYETTQVTNASTGFNETQGRLRVSGVGQEDVTSPYLDVSTDAFFHMTQIVSAMLPER